MFKALSMFWKKGRKTFKKITLGICAMDKKSQSKPMREILNRLPEDMFEIIVFGDNCIFNEPVENWPVVEVLITFYSTRFPTEKALEYIKLRKPYLINDLKMDPILKDRRKVYDLLESIGIDVPNHVFVMRNDVEEDTNVIEEFDEYIVVNGTQINKPLVEKPLDAEDHSVYIYYPMSAGGGSKRLFRKVDDRSSEFYPNENEVRRKGSFIYEEFVITQGTDVKVYTVGLEYAHAEARKSPVVDGRVKRDSDGREVRYPVILSPTEKIMARKIVQAFRQVVCGFDILRVHGKSYCCDVNGFSFVKNSRKYYEDASQILTEVMLNAVRPELLSSYSSRPPLARRISGPSPTPMLPTASAKHRVSSTPPLMAETVFDNTFKQLLSMNGSEGLEERPPSPAISLISETEYGNNTSQSSTYGSNNPHRYDTEELQCVIAVIRHGDRTPKQKMKVFVSEEKYLNYFHAYVKGSKKDLKVKSKSGLLEFLKVTKEIIEGNQTTPELKRKLIQIKDVLERWEISGINRKLQMKPQKWMEIEDGNSGNNSGINGEVKKILRATELLVIVKWGGDLTPLGREQAEQLGKLFRVENYPDSENGGVLRLHATYRHDLKIKASDEGRVMKTAAAFTKGLLELEGQLTPILASLVTVEEKNRQMLDRGGNFEMKEEMDRFKQHLNLLQVDYDITEEIIDLVAPGCSKPVKDAFYKLGNPVQTLKHMHNLVGELVNFIRELAEEQHQQRLQQIIQQQQQLLQQLQQQHGGGGGGGEGGGSLNININLPCDDNDNTSNNVMIDTNPSPDMIMITTTTPCCSFPSSPHTPNYIQSPQSPLQQPTPSNHSSCDNSSKSDLLKKELYLSETFDLMLERWQKLYKDFYHADTQLYDLTKVPDVYDMIRYDLFHNHHLCLPNIQELFELSSTFERCVVLQEYGIDCHDKRNIGNKMCGALLEKIKHDLLMSSSQQYVDHIQTQEINLLKEDPMLYKLDHSHAEDLQINSLQRCVRTRLYFTSESHIHTILNVFHYPPFKSLFSLPKEGLEILDSIINISYLSQIVIRLFEDRIEPQKYLCEVAFSSGTTDDPINDTLHSISPYIIVSKAVPLEQLIGCLTEAIHGYHHHDVPASASSSATANTTELYSSSISPSATPMKLKEDILDNDHDHSISLMNNSNSNKKDNDNDQESSIKMNHSVYAESDKSGICESMKLINGNDFLEPIPLRRNTSYAVNMERDPSDMWEKEGVQNCHWQPHPLHSNSKSRHNTYPRN